jgi:hypothetical protein
MRQLRSIYRNTMLASSGLVIGLLLMLGGCKKESFGTDSAFFIKYFGGPEQDAGADVLQKADGGYLLLGSRATGNGTTTEIWLVTADTAGNLLTQRSLGEGLASQLFALANGNFVVVGAVPDGSGNHDMLVQGVDATGQLLWTSILGGSGSDEVGLSGLERQDGGLVIVGKISDGSGTTDARVILASPTGSPQITYDYGFPGSNEVGIAALEVQPNIFLVSGDADGNPTTGRDIFALSIISPQQSIDQVWRWRIVGEQRCIGLTPLADGDYLLLGNESAGTSGRLVNAYWDPISLDSLRPDQAFAFGNYADFVPTALRKSKAGRNYVGGYTHGADFAVTTLDSNGTWLGQQNYAGATDERAYGIAGTSDGGYALVGTQLKAGTGMMMLLKDRRTF